MSSWTFTSESVTEGHPDKMADQISDSILDAMLDQDPMSRVACETFVTTGLAIVGGEITTKGYVDIPKIVRQTINDIGYNRESYGYDGNTVGVLVSLDEQSPDIAQGVDDSEEVRCGHPRRGPAQQAGRRRPGDDVRLRLRRDRRAHAAADPPGAPHGRAPGRGPPGRRRCPYLRPDGKTQVTFDYEDGKPVAAAHRAHLDPAQRRHRPRHEVIRPDLIEHVIRPVIPAEFADDDYDVFVNPTGRFVIGGPVGDAGLTGRKIIVDTYGGMGRHGGGAFSGKDPSKVDRSAAYAARWVAKNVVAAGAAASAARCRSPTPSAWPSPCRCMVETFGTEKVEHGQDRRGRREVFDLRPAAILRDLDLRRPIYKRTAAYGHFGRPAEDGGFTWEQHRQGRRPQARRWGSERSAALTLAVPDPRRRAAPEADADRRLTASRSRPAPIGPGEWCGCCPTRPASTRRSTTWSPTRSATRCASARWCGSSLHGRRVGGWVVADDVEPPRRRHPRPIAKVTGWGPPAELIDLADWAAWRWAGRPAHSCGTASPDHGGPGPAAAPAARRPPPAHRRRPTRSIAAEALAAGRAVVRAAARRPTPTPWSLAAAATGQRPGAGALGRRRPAPGPAAAPGRRRRSPSCPRTGPWPRPAPPWSARRAAAWAPVPRPGRGRGARRARRGASSRSRPPTWHARDVADRAGPPGRRAVRAGRRPARRSRRWPGVTLVAPSRRRRARRLARRRRRRPAPRGPRPAPGCSPSGWSPPLRGDGRVRVRAQPQGPGAAAGLRDLRRGGPLRALRRRRSCSRPTTGDARLRRAAATERPAGVPALRRHQFKNLRAGVTRVREELEALAGEPGGRGHRRATRRRARRAPGVVRRHRGGAAPGRRRPTSWPSSTSTRSCWPRATGPPRRRWPCWSGPPGWSGGRRARRPAAGADPPARATRWCRPRCWPIPARVSVAEADRRRRCCGFPPVTAHGRGVGVAAAAVRRAASVAARGRRVLGPSDGQWLRPGRRPPRRCSTRWPPRPAPGRLRIAVDPLRL